MADKQATRGTFWAACRDRRVWALFAVYGACFGLELTIDNVAALYFVDYFDELKEMDSLKAVERAGLFAGLFGGMNIFARALGGIIGDKFGARWGLPGRVKWLFIAVFCEGICLLLFSQVRTLVLAVPALMLFGLFVKMSNGATYSVVPFINKRALGSVAGIVGAGGNAGAVAAGFLFKMESLPWPQALFILGAVVTGVSFLSFAVTFKEAVEPDVHLTPERVPRGSASAPVPVPVYVE
jgi:NNP family nitrate/nitrite transporter-like MFS transporter